MKTNNIHDGLTRRRFVWSSVAGGLVGIFLSAPRRTTAQTKARITLRAISALPKNHISTSPLIELMSWVEKRSGGELVIQWKGGPEAVPSLQSGDAISKGLFDIAMSSPAFYAAGVPEGLAVFVEQASLKSLHASGALALLDQIHREKFGVALLGLSASSTGAVMITKTRPQNLEYFKGRKMRSGAFYTPMLRALGAATVTLGPTDLYSGLERGIVDGMPVPEWVIIASKLHEVAKFVLLPPFYNVVNSLVINRVVFEKLPAPLQKLLVESTREVEEWAANLYRAETQKAREQLPKMGLEYVQLLEAEAKRYLQIARDSLWEQVLKDSPQYGSRLKELFTKAAQMG